MFSWQAAGPLGAEASWTDWLVPRCRAGKCLGKPAAHTASAEDTGLARRDKPPPHPPTLPQEEQREHTTWPRGPSPRPWVPFHFSAP